MSIVVLVILAALLAWVVVGYNRLVRLRNQVANGWRQIDVQLKRRHDLIPNLVATVKGALEFEQDTLEKVTEARGRAISARGVEQAAAAENALTQALHRLVAVVERYPELSGSANVLRLQEELTTTENQIGFSRQHYNDIAMRFNTVQEVFPDNAIATVFGFQRADLFAADEADRVTPRVDLSLRSQS
jgi:LemA protein